MKAVRPYGVIPEISDIGIMGCFCKMEYEIGIVIYCNGHRFAALFHIPYFQRLFKKLSEIYILAYKCFPMIKPLFCG